MIRLQVVQVSDKQLLWNIFQKYMYEMSHLYLDEMDKNGDYPYEHFGDYFVEPKRVAYFIYNDATLIGFAMLCPYSCMGMEPDYTMAEFAIFPAFRKKRFAFEAVNQILKMHPGKWEIKYSEKNFAGKKLWNNVAAPYNPQIFQLKGDEIVLAFTC